MSIFNIQQSVPYWKLYTVAYQTSFTLWTEHLFTSCMSQFGLLDTKGLANVFAFKCADQQHFILNHGNQEDEENRFFTVNMLVGEVEARKDIFGVSRITNKGKPGEQHVVTAVKPSEFYREISPRGNKKWRNGIPQCQFAEHHMSL